MEKENTYPEVYLNEYDYSEIKNKPSQSELDRFYTQRYYQQSMGTYQKKYSTEEKKMIINKLERKNLIVNHLLDFILETKTCNFLDIGCGEGWALSYFHKKGWEVNGIDFSDFGCQNQNPGLLNKLNVGDITQIIEEYIASNQKFELIQLDNVLEHLLSPGDVVNNVKQLLTHDGILIIEVPNDFSYLQKYLLDNNFIQEKFWIVFPNHLSYFNARELINLFLNISVRKMIYR